MDSTADGNTASVFAAPQLPSAALPSRPPSMQVVFQKYMELKAANTPASDPVMSQVLGMLQAFKLKQEAQKARLATQHQQLLTSSDGQHPGPAAMTTSSVANASLTNGAVSTESTHSSSVSNGILSTDQLITLRNQITAFKLLSRNEVLPHNLREALLPTRSAPASLDNAPVAPLDASDPSVIKPPLESSGQRQRSHLDTFTDPRSLLPRTMPYHLLSQRQQRSVVPCLLPVGFDAEELRDQRERLIFSRINARKAELARLPAAMTGYDVLSEEPTAQDHNLKLEALIEFKKLGLLQKQRDLRQRVSRDILANDSLAVASNRAMYRRPKVPQMRDAQITEKLERDHRNARLDKERHVHLEYLYGLARQRQEMLKVNGEEKARVQRLGRIMLQTHQMIEKEEQKRVERTAKQRLQALKANDEEAYLKLLDQAKDTRITHLLRQTDGFLKQLTASVRAQQRSATGQTGVVSDTNESDADEEAEEGAGEDGSKAKVDYYEVAHKIKESVTKQPDMLGGGTLKDYQVKGLQWMISLYNNNLNGILADEMGLGKTIQTISLVTYLIEKKQQTGPFLIIVPLSTLSNWSLEFDRWAPTVRKIVYKGPPNSRKTHHPAIRYGDFEALLTTYEFVIKDRPILSKTKWTYMIVDEGHRMKNAESKLSSTITHYYNSRFRLILTGTPLQNNLPELWALLNFVLPTIFKSVKSFDEWFNTPFANTGGQDKIELTEEEQLLVIRRLHKVLRPFLLRRLKKDVEKDLPDKQESVVRCKFSALQAKLYKDLGSSSTLWVNGKSGRTNLKGLSNVLMQLRKVCNHPFVFEEVEDSLLASNMSPGGNRPVTDMIWRTAGKFELLDRILPKFQVTGHRILMFFQMTQIMTIMGDYLDYKGYRFLRLDGATKAEDRQDLLREFNAPNSPFDIFLLSTRAGGLGLNLQTADTVIIFDSDWNPHQDLQAQDRAHRIGQKNEVRILRLITSNSVEEKILERAQFKLDMDGKVIQAGKFDNRSSESDRDAMLRTLLDAREQAESLDEEEMDDDDLNEIMARSADELILFKKMDADRERDSAYGPGKPLQRLIQQEELPEVWLKEPAPEEEKEEEFLGRGARERASIRYDDGLTEEQWADAVDASDDDPDAARSRKDARISRRRSNKERRERGEVVNDSDSGDASRSVSPATQSLVKKARGRKPGVSNKRKPEEVGLDESSQPVKKHRGRWPKKVDILNAEDRADLQSMITKTYVTILDLKTRVAPEPEDSEHGQGSEAEAERLVASIFRRLPDRKMFADYYQIIPEPICLDQIKKKIDKKEYNDLAGFRADLDRLCSNARMYNEDGSNVYNDAELIQVRSSIVGNLAKDNEFVLTEMIADVHRVDQRTNAF